VLEKFGGDAVTETLRNLTAYVASIPPGLRTGSTLTPHADPEETDAGESDPGESDPA
jgi:hypothetical protein